MWRAVVAALCVHGAAGMRVVPVPRMASAQLGRECVSIVTGASRGIGKGIAVELGRAGATVYVVGRSSRERPTRDRALPEGEELTVEATAEAVSAAGGCGIAAALDASDDSALEALVARVAREKGRLDVLVCSAFTTPPKLNEDSFRGPFWQQGAAMWDAVHGVGLRSSYVLCCEAAPLLMETAAHSRPLVALVSSFGGKAYTFNVAYGVGKAATDRLARDMAVQLGPRGVDTVAVYPGIVSTEGNLELARRGEWEAASGGFAFTETPAFSGRVLVEYLRRRDLRRANSGSVQVVAELAADFGITDLDGSQPPSIRSLKFLVPNYVLPDAKLKAAFPPQIATSAIALRDRLLPDYCLDWSLFAEPPPTVADGADAAA